MRVASPAEIVHWADGPLPDAVSCRIIEDSQAPAGHRMTTYELRYPRFMHAEVMTHGIVIKNAASSRARPYKVVRAEVLRDCAGPVEWPKNKKGMQGGDLLSDVGADAARFSWMNGAVSAVETSDWFAWYDTENDRQLDPDDPDDVARAQALGMTEYPLHKSIPNRIIEPWMYITVTCTGTDWEGFFNQRSRNRTDGALPEFGELARMMEDLYFGHTPVQLSSDPGTYAGWHLPYIRDDERFSVPVERLRQLSVARCARTSYLTHAGLHDPEDDVRLYNELKAPPWGGPQHASPFGHVATPEPENEYIYKVRPARYGCEGDPLEIRVPILGNCRGFMQFRHIDLGW